MTRYTPDNRIPYVEPADYIHQFPAQVSEAGANLMESIITELERPATPDQPGRMSAADKVKLDQVEAGTNLFNPELALTGYVLSNRGVPVASVNYTTTSLIPVTPGESYTLSAPRSFAQYDASGDFLPGSYVDNGTQETRTFTAHASAQYMRASVHNLYHLGTFQVEEGTEATPWEPYQFKFPLLQISPEQLAASAPVTVEKNGDELTVRTSLGPDPLTMTLRLRGGNNRIFNFGPVVLGAYETIAFASDDVAPIRTQQGTVGGNHGFPTVGIWPSGTHNKTTADLGSVWTDGTREYVILQINEAGGCVVGAEYSRDPSGAASTVTVAPATDLTHVSGANNTTALPAGSVTRGQLWPSVRHVRQHITIDGAPVTEGMSAGALLNIRESYEVMDYSAVYDTAKSNPGSPFTDHEPATAVRMENEWTIGPGGKMRGTVAVTEVSPTRLGAVGFFQMQVINGTVTRYIPGVKPIDGLDWSAGVPLSALSSNQIVTVDDLHRSDQAPTVLIDDRGDSAAVLSLDAWEGDSSNAHRLERSPSQLWDIRSTSKVYPNAILSADPGWGRITGHGTRAYLTPDETGLLIEAGTDSLHASATINLIT